MLKLYQEKNIKKIGRKFFIKEYISTGSLIKVGYRIVTLSKKGTHHKKYIHRLVAEAFISNPYNKKYVNHIDGNKQNNRIDNLEWCTASENNLHAFKTGLKKVTEKQRIQASKNGKIYCSKNVIQYDLNGNFIKEWNSLSEASRILNVNRGNIGTCCRLKKGTAGGYIWKFKEEGK